LDKTAQSARAALTSSSFTKNGSGANKPEAPQADRKEQKRIEAEQRQARSAGRRAQRERVAGLEAEILQLETRQKELAADLENPAIYQQPGKARDINLEWSANSSRLEQLAREWEQAAGEALAEE
jgi:ATP-binding cassette subfamily F protein 3